MGNLFQGLTTSLWVCVFVLWAELLFYGLNLRVGNSACSVLADMYPISVSRGFVQFVQPSKNSVRQINLILAGMEGLRPTNYLFIISQKLNKMGLQDSSLLLNAFELKAQHSGEKHLKHNLLNPLTKKETDILLQCVLFQLVPVLHQLVCV